MLRYIVTALIALSIGLFAGPMIAPTEDALAIKEENAQILRENELMQQLITELEAEREEVRAVLEGGN